MQHGLFTEASAAPGFRELPARRARRLVSALRPERMRGGTTDFGALNRMALASHTGHVSTATAAMTTRRTQERVISMSRLPTKNKTVLHRSEMAVMSIDRASLYRYELT